MCAFVMNVGAGPMIQPRFPGQPEGDHLTQRGLPVNLKSFGNGVLCLSELLNHGIMDLFGRKEGSSTAPRAHVAEGTDRFKPGSSGQEQHDVGNIRLVRYVNRDWRWNRILMAGRQSLNQKRPFIALDRDKP